MLQNNARQAAERVIIRYGHASRSYTLTDSLSRHTIRYFFCDRVSYNIPTRRLRAQPLRSQRARVGKQKINHAFPNECTRKGQIFFELYQGNDQTTIVRLRVARNTHSKTNSRSKPDSSIPPTNMHNRKYSSRRHSPF